MKYRHELVITERFARRVALLWRRLLENPQYDNGDASFQGLVSQTLASMMPANNTAPVLDDFERALTALLLDETRSVFARAYQSVDYGPDELLHAAAQQAGLNMKFPWKTRVEILETGIGVQAGYDSETVFHYPLSGERWLVTRLQGSDINKLIVYVETGVLPVFEVETPSRTVLSSV